MIKVGWENLNNSVENSTIPFSGCFDSLVLKYPDNTAEQQINYCTSDFLGLKSPMKNKPGWEADDCDLLKKAKDFLGRIFKSDVGLFFDEKAIHLNVLNHLVSENDIIVVDQFVNTNIELASDCLKKRGVKVFSVSHNNLCDLEEIIKDVDSSAKVWYLTQGTYPVPGNQLPVSEIKQLFDKYPNLFLYADDSNSLGWTGNYGCGLIRQHFSGNNRVVLTASLAKGFGAEGGIVVIFDGFTPLADIHTLTLRKKRIVRSIIDSAEIMLTDSIGELQSKLQENISLFNNRAQRNDLPIISSPNLPMVFIAAGTPVCCGEICSAVLNEGMFISSACFPQLPLNCSGIKINITLKHSSADIKNLVDALAEAYSQNPIKEKIHTNTCRYKPKKLSDIERLPKY